MPTKRSEAASSRIVASHRCSLRTRPTIPHLSPPRMRLAAHRLSNVSWLPLAPYALVSLLVGDAAPADATRLVDDVKRLASDRWKGRRAGSREADEAATWIAERFKSIGLKPAFGTSYLQSFGFIDGVTLGNRSRLVIGGKPFHPGEDFRPVSFSAAGSVDAMAVFAGYGLVAKDLGVDDYGGKDVRGKVVLVLRHSPAGDDPQSKYGPFVALRHKAANAHNAGAAALLVVTGPTTAQAKDELVPMRSDASLVDAGIPVMSVKRRVAEALLEGSGTTLEAAQRSADAGHGAYLELLARVALGADVKPKRSATHNVAATLPGSDPDAGIVVVGAHYDHLGLGLSGSLEAQPEGKIHHGADDNASGVAAMLEVARALAREQPARTLIFAAFGAEELGALGSSYFVKSPPVPFEQIAAMVNLDMVGRLREDALDVHGVGTSPVWRRLVEEANRGPALKLHWHEGGLGPSDHSSFYLASKPVLFLFTGVHSDYHRASDTADKLNAAGLARVTDLVTSIVAGLAASSSPVSFTRVAAEKEEQLRGSRGFRVWVGGIPNYGSEAPGVRISGVTPGSPAEKAGLRGGDTIVRFGEREIRNIYDYTAALGERKPGEVVEIAVVRDGAEVVIAVTLG